MPDANLIIVPEVFNLMLKKFGQGKNLKIISSDLPEDAVFEGVSYNYDTKQFLLRYSHPSFEPVAAGDLLPELELMFEWVDGVARKTRIVTFVFCSESELESARQNKRVVDTVQLHGKLKGSVIEALTQGGVHHDRVSKDEDGVQYTVQVDIDLETDPDNFDWDPAEFENRNSTPD